MNRFFTLFFVAFVTLSGIFAAPVNPDRAKQTAANFLIQKSTMATSGNKNLKMLKAPNLKQVGDELAVANQQFFVFNHGNDQGYVIVAADDRAYPILGYVDNGSFEPNNIPPNVQKWLEGYKVEIRYAVENNIEISADIQAQWQALLSSEPSHASVNVKSSVSPLISEKWNQSPYYNDLCPYNTSHRERTVTGCVATAMAQVMKYWNYPTIGSGFHSYNHSIYGTLSANFGSTTYNWTNMPNQLNSSSSSAEKNAVATLMYHCGVSVDMDYGVASTGGSGAYVISSASPVTHCTEYALKTYFGYKTTLKGVKKANYTQTNWINLLKAELDAGRPMVYAGFGDGGHCFVCDGYDNNDYFHFNWGWGGSYDGYFVLNALNPGSGGIGGGSYSYNDGQQAVIGIEPANGGTTPQNYDLRLYSNLNMSETQIWFRSDFSATVSIGNYGTSNFSGQLCAAIFDNDGNFIDFMETTPVTLQNNYYNTYTFNNTSSTVFVPGTYYVAVFYKTTTQDWTIVADGNYTNLQQFKIYYSSSIEVNSAFTITTNGGKLIQGQSATVNVDVLNTGNSTFYGSFRVNLANLDGSWVQNIQILNENNGLPYNYHYTNGNNFTGIITVAPGTYLMEIGYQAQGSSSWYYAGSTNYSNPVYVIVEAPDIQQDIYEPNNTQSQAYNLSVNFSNNSANVNTPGSNFHVGIDIDYYKIVLSTGYNYTISPRLHDSYNSGNGQTYTVDALFSYSTNGTTYSETYDDIMTSSISIENGGTLYFKVAPYFSGSTGTYLLDMEITRTPITTSVDNIGLNHQISIYPNPANDFVVIDLQGFIENVTRIVLYDVQGRQIYSEYNTVFAKTINLPLNNIPNGVYFVQIHSDKGILTQKIIVAK